MHNKIFYEAISMKEQAQQMLNCIDGTKRLNDQLIDVACTVIKQANKILEAYSEYAVYIREVTPREIKKKAKPKTKAEKIASSLEKIDFIGKGLAYVKKLSRQL